MSNIKVLYISYDGMTDPLGQSQVIPYLKGLSKEGYQFTLLSCEKKERYKKSKDFIQKMLNEYGIIWHPLLYHKNPPVLSTLYDYFKLKSIAKKLHKEEKFKIVHCRSYISSLVGLYLKKNFNVPFIFDMRGFWADERVDGGLWNLKNPLHKLIYNYFKKKEELFLQYSGATISLTEAGKNEMMNWKVCRSNDIDIFVIPCSTDFDFFIKSDAEKIISQKASLGIPQDSFVLSYLGSIGTWYMLDEMLDLFKLLLNKYNNSVFLILTPDDPNLVYSKLKIRGINKEKVMVQFSSRNDLVDKMSVSDLSVFFIKPCYSKLSSSPTKLGELLAMEIPVISNSGVGDVNKIIEGTGGGIVIQDFDNKNYDDVIQKIYLLKSLDRKLMREKAKSYFDLQNAVKKYSEVYEKLRD